jgi:hypothetical protein
VEFRALARAGDLTGFFREKTGFKSVGSAHSSKQLTLNQRVQGSSPCAATNKINHLGDMLVSRSPIQVINDLASDLSPSVRDRKSYLWEAHQGFADSVPTLPGLPLGRRALLDVPVRDLDLTSAERLMSWLRSDPLCRWLSPLARPALGSLRRLRTLHRLLRDGR